MNLWKVISRARAHAPAYLATFVICLVSFGTGFFVANLRTKDRQAFSGRPHVSMRDVVQRMESRLELSADQKEKVSAILQARREQMHALMNEVRPQIKAAEKAMREQIEALLSEEQRGKFEEVFSRRGMRSGRSSKSMRGNDRREQGTRKRREEPGERVPSQNTDSGCSAEEVEEIPENPEPSEND